MRRRHAEAEPVRITSAPRTPREDIAGRQRRYLISMGVRTVCFVLMVLSIGHWYAWVFLVGAVVLPYVAVVVANAGSRPDIGGDEFAYRPDLQAIEAPREPLVLPTPAREPAGPTTSAAGEDVLLCSAKECRVPARWSLLWNNPKIHDPDRRKAWLACDTHREPLSSFLGARGFLREVRAL